MPHHPQRLARAGLLHVALHRLPGGGEAPQVQREPEDRERHRGDGQRALQVPPAGELRRHGDRDHQDGEAGGLGTINTLIFALQADTVDYGEWKSGVRAEGGSYSVLSFTRKTGQGIGGAAAAYIIGAGGYVATATTQSHSALTSIRLAAGIVPAALTLAAAAVMLAYPLTEKAFRAMVAEVAERRATAELGLPAAESATLPIEEET